MTTRIATTDKLAVLDDIERRLAGIERIDEAKSIRDQAEAIRMYAKNARKGLTVQNRAALIKILAEQRAGHLIAKIERGQGRQGQEKRNTLLQNLKENEIDRMTAHRWQVLSTVQEAIIRAREAECNDQQLELTSAAIYTAHSRQQQERTNKAELGRRVDVEAHGIYHGDFRERYATVLKPESVQLVLTDPPYDKDSVELFAAAAEAAAHVLRPGGSFLIYSGQKYLGDVYAAIEPHLRYWWTFALVHRGPSQLLQKLGVRCGWKPVLWFVKATRGDVSAIVADVIDGAGREKDQHVWQQAEAEAAALIERFTTPGDLVVDFFAGSGTVLVAAKRLERRFAGFETRADYVEKIAARVA